MQQVSEPVILSSMIVDCDAQMAEGFRLMSQMFLSGATNKRAVLHAFESFETNYNCCCDITDRCVTLAIDADKTATDEDRDILCSKIRGIQMRWAEMIRHAEAGIMLFGVIADVSRRWMH